MISLEQRRKFLVCVFLMKRPRFAIKILFVTHWKFKAHVILLEEITKQQTHLLRKMRQKRSIKIKEWIKISNNERKKMANDSQRSTQPYHERINDLSFLFVWFFRNSSHLNHSRELIDFLCSWEVFIDDLCFDWLWLIVGKTFECWAVSFCHFCEWTVWLLTFNTFESLLTFIFTET